MCVFADGRQYRLLSSKSSRASDYQYPTPPTPRARGGAPFLMVFKLPRSLFLALSGCPWGSLAAPGGSWGSSRGSLGVSWGGLGALGGCLGVPRVPGRSGRPPRAVRNPDFRDFVEKHRKYRCNFKVGREKHRKYLHF